MSDAKETPRDQAANENEACPHCVYRKKIMDAIGYKPVPGDFFFLDTTLGEATSMLKALAHVAGELLHSFGSEDRVVALVAFMDMFQNAANGKLAAPETPVGHV